ncbi:MAG: AAA family ATPase [Firmicutes bacterium]|nr:AAA family ATPase [Bacillota bacterium]MCL2255676.1 AAA family ATPase [Bacillota bacterium]
MIYLENFKLIDEEQDFQIVQKIKNAHTRDELFPLGFFAKKQLARVDFDRITIFYGGNGSGKSTLLNLVAERLNLMRHADNTLTGGFYDYADNCVAKVKKIPGESRLLTSEDVFKNIFETRSKNTQIAERKSMLDEEFDYSSNDFMFDGFENSHLISKKQVKRSFVEKNTASKERQYSNGENALRFFKGEMQKKSLYFLDEPENSMSPKYQMELKKFLEGLAYANDCQLVIATHSPFILALKDAKVYSLDDTPVNVQKWYELKNIRLYHQFFSEHRDLFEIEDWDGKMKKTKKK